MTLYEILLYILITFTIYNLLLRFYPLNFIRSAMTRIVRKTQHIILLSSFMLILITIALKVFIIKDNMVLTIYDFRLSILIILLGVSSLFVLLILLPCSWLLIKINEKDFKILDSLQDAVINMVYNSGEIGILNKLYYEQKETFSDYGIFKTVDLFIKRYNQMNNCPKDLSEFLLKRCFEVLQINEKFEPNPFAYFSILLSFSTSTVFVFLISILTVDFS